MLATLPMYDFPEVREATDAFWAAIAKAYGVTGKLTRDADCTTTWHNPKLLFSQTCGYPYTHEFRGVLNYVATPHYTAEGCDGANYRSIIFAREHKPLPAFEGTIAAFNNRDSMSGMLALKLVFAPLAKQSRFFGKAMETGGHINSLQFVQSAKADICAIDCVTVAYLERYRPSALEGLVEIASSPLVPALPFVTRGGDAKALKKALLAVCNDTGYADMLNALFLKTVTALPARAYDIIVTREEALQGTGDLHLWA